MNKQPTYSRFKSPIGAGEEITVHNVGNLVSLLGATGPVEIALGDGAFIPLDVGQTVSFQDEEFDQVRIRDASNAVNSVDIYVGRGEFFDLRFSAVGVVKTTARAPELFENYVKVCTNAVVTEFVPDDPYRDEITIVNGAGSSGPIHVGGSATAVQNEGIPVQPGQSYTLRTRAPIYVRNDSGADATVRGVATRYSS